ncbi:ABC transporter substrate-binding protein [Rhodococcus sp. ACPA4]|uniref:ABC transporter substrate-binding protein n=1 Tax=Rhodococcus sp. ACPA4 TaxID=2028571 RepID=UPI000BB114A2|nr:ABC transporter substrate-binding protein [Rhodococcus sp. ACPA4]PBC42989.1 ABC transporter substrate-binding protein [Rhodococcus sp. ACPA4]
MKPSNGLHVSKIVAASIAVVAMTAMTACSSESAGDTSDSSSSSSSADLPAGAFPGIAATGTPVKIGFINNENGQAVSQPENREAAEAAAKYANEQLGGIGGRPVELVICKQQEEPVSARDCANQMVEAKVSAVVLPSSGLGQIIAPIITSAGIPYVAALGGSAVETTGDGAYMWTAGSNTSQAMAQYAGEKGMKNVVAYTIDLPAATGSLEQIGVPAFAANGANLKIIPIPFGTPDATPQVNAGLDSNPDGIVVYGESTICTSILKALNTLGSTTETMAVQSCANADVVDAVGAAMEGTKIIGSADTVSNSPESVLYREVMKKYSPNTPVEGYAVTGYQGMLGLIRATKSVTGTDTSPAALDAAIRSAKDIPLPAGAGLTFTCDGQAIAGFKAVCGNGLIVLTMKDGVQTDPATVIIK